MTITKKVFASLTSVALAFVLCITPMAFADDTPADNTSADSTVASSTPAGSAPLTDTVPSSTPANDCVAVVKYYEYADYYDPDFPLDDSGRIFLGELTLDGLCEGDVLDAWDYVVDIPGHFFFDGWPAIIKVSTDPSKNIFELHYFKKYEYEYTVNYYLMVGADLTADNWAGALAPEDVEFIKMGSETFTDQRINQLVTGDAYQYQLDGMYVIDTYPAQIRVGLDADDNVLNVLYTPDSLNLPDDFEVPDDVYMDTPPDGDSDSALPPDESFDKDDMIALLPDDVEVPADSDNQEIFDDFIGNDPDSDDGFLITEDMLQNPVDKEEAQEVIAAYKAGRNLGSMAQTGDTTDVWISVAICAGGIAAGVLLTVAIMSLVKRNQRKNKA